MKISVADLLDRLIILELKRERGADVDKEIEDINEELSIYHDIEIWKEKLKKPIQCGWNTEDRIQKYIKKKPAGVITIGIETIKGRKFNLERIEIRNKINQYYKQGYKEVKTFWNI